MIIKRKNIRVVIIAVSLIIFIFSIKAIIKMGVVTSIKGINNWNCEKIGGLPGSEDIVIDHESGIAFISSQNRRMGDKVQGGIFELDLNVADSVPRKLTDNMSFDFHPHGIDLFVSESGERFLHVINHRKDGHYIEIFTYEGELNHIKSVSGKGLVSPNDILAVGIDKFYISNDHMAKSFFTEMIETFLMLPFANITYYNGNDFFIADNFIAFPNGLAISDDGKIVYSSSTIGQTLKIYSRNMESGHLKKINEIRISSGLDNLDMDDNGKLWLGAHPKLLAFMNHATDEKVISPSEIYTIDTNNDYKVEKVFLDEGNLISGSSVAAKYRNTILIGSVFEDFILKCTVDN